MRALNGVRGLAILLVLLPHVAMTGTLPGPEIVQHVTLYFAHGVELFFVLSGFVIALPVLVHVRDHGSTTFDNATFYVNRLFRILPAYYAAVAFSFAVNIVYVRTLGPLPGALSLPHTLWQAVGPLLFLDFNNVPMNLTLWTIPVQLRWYLVCPLLIMLYVRSRRAFCVLLLATTIAYHFTRLRSLDLGTIALFMLGIIAADLYVRRVAAARWLVLLVPAGIVLGHFEARFAMLPQPDGSNSFGVIQPTMLSWQLAAFGLVVAVTAFPRLNAVFASFPLQALGTISFSLYLIHEPVISFVARAAGGHHGIFALTLALFAGLAFWWTVERPLSNARARRRAREFLLPHVRGLLAAIGISDTLALSGPPPTERLSAQYVTRLEPPPEPLQGAVSA
jgi:peptidoglycan/LPS O-acetylase OafA/YrhL